MESITIKKINKIDNIVASCLRQIPETRDNDKLLILKIWGHQNPKLRQQDFSFISFAEDFLKSNYAEPSTITRSRRKLQEKHPELRGKLWNERHNEAQKTREGMRN